MSMANEARAAIATGDGLDVRLFKVTQGMSKLFSVELTVVSRNLDIDLDAAIGEAASFSLTSLAGVVSFEGVLTEMDQVRVDREGLATYRLVIAPRAHLLTQRTNYRIFQYKSELDIVQQLLSEWGVKQRSLCDAAKHKPRKYRTQYGESDFTFMCRMLEDAGISFWFEGGPDGTTLVLDDEPQSRELTHPAVRFHDTPQITDGDYVTKVAVSQRVRPGKATIGDLDYRRASTSQPRLSSTGGLEQERELEQFHYEPGAFLYQGKGGGGSTPAADDRGTTRTDESSGANKTKARLFGHRQDATLVRFESNLIDLVPGLLLGVIDHPHERVGASGLLVTGAVLSGVHDGDWRVQVESVGADQPFRPRQVTPKPSARGIESATVVGPAADEIHTDEYARVRVHFHWDRESQRDDKSSCWIPTNQPWAGAGFGGTVLPRIGQEVMVEFLGCDPDRPVVIGRTYTEHQPPPYPLPAGKRITGLIGRTTPKLVMGGAVNQYFGSVINTQVSKTHKDEPFAAKPPKEYQVMKRDNAFLLGDQQGDNLVYLKAMRDLNILVKHKWTTVVGNYRGTRIFGDDKLHVRNKQNITVVGNQKLVVTENQTIWVGKKREEKIFGDLGLIVHGDGTISSEKTIEHKAKKSISIESDECIRLRVGNSAIIIDENTIVFESPKVDINP